MIEERPTVNAMSVSFRERIDGPGKRQGDVRTVSAAYTGEHRQAPFSLIDRSYQLGGIGRGRSE